MLGTQTEIFLEDQKNLGKLQVYVTFKELQYDPASKKTRAVLTVGVVYPDTEYNYGGTRILGNAAVEDNLGFPLKTAKETEEIQTRVSNRAEVELSDIKNEIDQLLRFRKKVSVPLDKVLTRIIEAISRDIR
jgi:hypothetical protein